MEKIMWIAMKYWLIRTEEPLDMIYLPILQSSAARRPIAHAGG
ncbi:MAG TPA: hypothetical protein VIW25_12520 [Nitrososphaeraceae archaeon]